MQVTKPYMLWEARRKSKARTKRTASIRAMRQRTAVEDLDVACHRADLGILEHGGDDLVHRVRCDDAVRVDGDEKLTRALGKAGVEALFLAPVFGEADGLDEFGITFLGPVDVSPGVVLGAVVDADNLQPIGRIVGGGYGGNGLFHHGPFVVGRDNDRYPRQAPFGQRIRFIAHQRIVRTNWKPR